ncbi:unnamed protein product [Fraxinus pennsylvanica]|uniref:C3H1-type domain-containing protein n=1 Tax=Fraxinus pennsylvanica TaxID=56036 RepID=A0AAD2E8W0_9LAMI|nr:unnamed protein product [Fraxinus pennsylvanica]
MDTRKLTVETDDSFSSLLEFAANNDVVGFKRSIEYDSSGIDEAGLWYVRKKGSKQIVHEERTPLMVAATYGSVDVLNLLVAQCEVDLNRSCGPDKCTALHCAASGGSINALDVVKLLVSAGADPNIENSDGERPVDVIVCHPKLLSARAALQELLMNICSGGLVDDCNLQVSVSTSNASSPLLSSSPDCRSTCSPPSDSVSSPMASKFNDVPSNFSSEKKEYPVDPSLPDIKNSIYSTDEFRMFSFKVRPCSRAYSHDWTECPFVHPGENARRRDPRKYHYSCVPCPEFRKGVCRRGDMCEYAHGVFECWLHPAQYRTRLCKDGTSCERRVCFFAHTPEELRPLYISTGSTVPSPRSAASAASVMDMAAALSLFPGSPSSHTVISPAFNQPMSPTANGMSHSAGAWPQPNVPTLHLPGSNLQSSRLRSSLSARDIPPEDLDMLQDFDAQQLVMNDLASFAQSRSNSASLNRSGRSMALTPSNLDELFSAEVSLSPSYSDQAVSSGILSPRHKSAVLNPFQQQSMLSSMNGNVFSPKNGEHPLFQGSFGISSPRMSPRNVEPISPRNTRFSAFAQHEMQQLQHLRSVSSRELGSNFASIVGSPVNTGSKWGSSPHGKVDWSVNSDDLGCLQRSSTYEVNNNNGGEPDLSWVHSLVKESPPEMMVKHAAPISGNAPSGEGLKSNSQIDSVDHSLLGSLLEQMQLDQLVA